MVTLEQLPDISGHRFGNITLGYDRVDQIRAEVSTLEALAALVCRVDRSALTLEMIQRVTREVETRIAALTPEDYAEWRDEDPQRLLAVALALQPI